TKMAITVNNVNFGDHDAAEIDGAPLLHLSGGDLRRCSVNVGDPGDLALPPPPGERVTQGVVGDRALRARVDDRLDPHAADAGTDRQQSAGQQPRRDAVETLRCAAVSSAADDDAVVLKVDEA